MRATYLVLTLLGLSFWGNQATCDQPTINEIISSFKVKANQYGVTPDFKGLSVAFIPALPNNMIALCWTITRNKRMVLIVKDTFDRSTYIEKEYTIWHELGHCTLHRDHSLVYRKGHPISMMYPDNTLVKTQLTYYLQNKKYFEKELFLGN